MKIIGHRGAKGLAPENTLTGLQKALDHGVDGIEVDIRLTADGQVVLIHDEELHNSSGDKLTVATNDLAALELHNPNVTTLTAAIEAIDRRVPLLLEIKVREATGPTAEIISHYLSRGWKAQDFMFLSFDYGTLKQLRATLPEVPVMINETWSGIRAHWRAWRLKTPYIDLERHSLWSVFIRSVARSSFHLYSFTVNDIQQAQKWQKAGLYAIITDFPDRFEK